MGYRRKEKKPELVRKSVLERKPKEYDIYDYRPQLNLKLLELGLAAFATGRQLYKSLPAESFAVNRQAYGMDPAQHIWSDLENVSLPELKRRSREQNFFGFNMFKDPKPFPNVGAVPDQTHDFLVEAEKRIQAGSLIENQAFNVQPRNHISVESRITSSGFKPRLETIAEETAGVGKKSFGNKVLKNPSLASALEKETVTIQPYPYPIEKPPVPAPRIPPRKPKVPSPPKNPFSDYYKTKAKPKVPPTPENPFSDYYQTKGNPFSDYYQVAGKPKVPPKPKNPFSDYYKVKK